MEFFDNLFGRKKDKPVAKGEPVTKDEKETFRDSEVYQRLKTKFVEGEVDIRSGLESGSFNCGRLG